MVVGMQHFVAYPRNAFHVILVIAFAASPINLPKTNQSLLPYLELKQNTAQHIMVQRKLISHVVNSYTHKPFNGFCPGHPG